MFLLFTFNRYSSNEIKIPTLALGLRLYEIYTPSLMFDVEQVFVYWDMLLCWTWKNLLYAMLMLLKFLRLLQSKMFPDNYHKNTKALLDIGNRIFCCTSSRENYFEWVSRQNSNYHTFQERDCANSGFQKYLPTRIILTIVKSMKVCFTTLT